MSNHARFNESDILAWADGQLDGDPTFKAALEERIRTDPDLEAKARAYLAQNSTLRGAYEHRLYEPVPAHLTIALDNEPKRHAPAVLRIAAMAIVLVSAALAGWVLGVSRENDSDVATLLDRSYGVFTSEQPREPAQPVVEAAVANGRPIHWLQEKVELHIQAPDLSEQGFALVDKEAIRFSEGSQFIRLDYAGTDGEAFSLFLAPRWSTEPEPVLATRRNGVSSAFWVSGPLVSTVLSRLPKETTQTIAEAARRAMFVENGGSPTVEPGSLRDNSVGRGISANANGAAVSTPSTPDGETDGGPIAAN